MKINAYVISSGSKGNATLIYTENTSILVDLGVNIKKLERNYVRYQKKLKILITLYLLMIIVIILNIMI